MTPMLARFSLYGFLKNQRYFEPFLVLMLLDRGIGFTGLGVLLAVRHGTRVVGEIPSGVVADLQGRRTIMVLSMVSYIAAFALFLVGSSVVLFAPAMLLFGLGDALRSGTHKAMILHWLRLGGREAERTRVYGYTRSWSKLGSAVGVIVGVALVLASGAYELAFAVALVPYVLNLVNLATYPRVLDERAPTGGSPRAWVQAAVAVFRELGRNRGQRRIMAESVGYAVTHAPVEDYLQPMLLTAAVAAPFLAGMDDLQRSTLLVGVVYLALHLVSAVASRNAHRIATGAGGVEPGARRIWWVTAASFAAVTVALWLGVHPVVLAGFVVLLVVHEAWRPILVSRLDQVSDPASGATVFSVESQARSLAVACCAPILGAVLDAVNRGAEPGEWTFWPLGVLGLAVAAVALVIPPPWGSGQPSRATPAAPRPPRPSR